VANGMGLEVDVGQVVDVGLAAGLATVASCCASSVMGSLSQFGR
jgi:hypothetical protein